MSGWRFMNILMRVLHQLSTTMNTMRAIVEIFLIGFMLRVFCFIEAHLWFFSLIILKIGVMIQWPRLQSRISHRNILTTCSLSYRNQLNLHLIHPGTLGAMLSGVSSRETI